MPDPLDFRALLELLPILLPRSTSSPLPRPTDVVAALVHAIHTSLNFRISQSTSKGSQPTGSSRASDTTSTEEREVDDGASDTDTAVDNDDDGTSVDNALNSGWNDRGEDTYSFEYKHEQSSMTFRVRVGKMGGRIQIDATAEVSSRLRVEYGAASS